MIDFIKVRINVPDPEEFMKHTGFDRTSDLNHETGEIFYPIIVKFNNITVKAYPSGLVYITGSIHKFKNGGKFNYDDFSFSMIVSTIHDIFDRFGLPMELYKLENLEIGVNICPPIETNFILDSLLFHGRSFFEYASVNTGKYLQSSKSEYFLKVYDKATQQEQPGRILRWEIKFKRMRLLNTTYHVSTIADLLDETKLQSISNLLNKEWRNVVMVDPTINLDDLTFLEKSNYYKWSSQIWWRKLDKLSGKKDINKFSRTVGGFRKFTKQNSENIQQAIGDLILAKVNQLINQ